MTLTHILRMFYTLSQAANDEEERLSAKMPRGMRFPPHTEKQAKLQTAYLEAERPAGDALEAFLNDLDKKTLTAISALMYSGRDHTELDLAEHDHWETEDLMRSILEKMPRASYIAAGVERYGASRIEELVH